MKGLSYIFGTGRKPLNSQIQQQEKLEKKKKKNILT